MKSTDVLTLLVYAAELDGRHAPNEAKVLAWKDVLDECDGMPLSFAKNVARRHYGKTDDMLTPATLVRAWKQHEQQVHQTHLAVLTERACGFRSCLCTHESPCFKGWIDSADGASTAPCPTCRGELLALLQEIPGPGKRNQAHMQKLSIRGER